MSRVARLRPAESLLVVLLVLLIGATTARADTDPIVGNWHFDATDDSPGGDLYIGAEGSGAFRAIVTSSEFTLGPSCAPDAVQGQTFEMFNGGQGSYSGTQDWVNGGDCSTRTAAPATVSVTGDELEQCSDDPFDGDETACYDATRAEPPQAPSATAPSPSSRTAPGNPCGRVVGSIGKRLLASATCSWAQTKLEAKCGVAVSGFVFLPLKSLRAAKTSKGLLDLRKLKKSLRPAGKLYNKLSAVKYVSHAPRGFRTPAEVKATIDGIRTGRDLIKLLPSLRRATSQKDFSQIALDLAEIGGLKPCVQGLANAIGS